MICCLITGKHFVVLIRLIEFSSFGLLASVINREINYAFCRNDLFASLFGRQPISNQMMKGEVRPKVTKNDLADFKLFS